MAFSDYGCLIKKNKVLLTEEEQDDLTDALHDGYHGVIGTKDCYIGFYKHSAKLVMDGEVAEHYYMHNFNGRKSIRLNFDGRELRIKNVTNKYKGDSYRYMVSWIDRDGTRWNAMFGGGVGYWCKRWWHMMDIQDKAVDSF